MTIRRVSETNASASEAEGAAPPLRPTPIEPTRYEGEGAVSKSKLVAIWRNSDTDGVPCLLSNKVSRFRVDGVGQRARPCPNKVQAPCPLPLVA